MTWQHALALLTIIGLLGAGMRYPGALLASCFFTFQASELSGIQWVAPAIGVIASVVSIVQFNRNPVRLKVTTADIGLALLVFYLAVSTIWSRDQDESYADTSMLVQSVVCMYLIARLRAHEPKKLITQLLLSLSIAGAIFALIMLHERLDYTASLAMRLTVSGERASAVGLAAPLPFVMLASTFNGFLSRRKLISLISAICLAISAYASTVSATRGVFIAYGAGLLLGLPLLVRHVRARRFGILILAATIAVVGLVAFMPADQLQNSLDRLFGNFVGSRVVADTSSSERLFLWHTAGDIFSKYPFFGAGYGSFGSYSFFSYPHNIFIEVAASAGMVGLLLMGVWLVGVVLNLIAVKRRLGGYGAILIALWVAAFVHMQVSFSLAMGKPLFLMSALVGAMAVNAANSGRRSRPAAKGTSVQPHRSHRNAPA